MMQEMFADYACCRGSYNKDCTKQIKTELHYV